MLMDEPTGNRHEELGRDPGPDQAAERRETCHDGDDHPRSLGRAHREASPLHRGRVALQSQEDAIEAEKTHRALEADGNGNSKDEQGVHA